jgi:hypothetical protein
MVRNAHPANRMRIAMARWIVQCVVLESPHDQSCEPRRRMFVEAIARPYHDSQRPSIMTLNLRSEGLYHRHLHFFCARCIIKLELRPTAVDEVVLHGQNIIPVRSSFRNA